MMLTLGISPCPNDTFIFDALVNGRVATDLRFEVVHEDVETLNGWACAGRLDVSKVSYGVLPLLGRDYRLLSSGGALGEGVGPLLVTRAGAGFDPATARVAIPGRRTTAHLLFSLAYPQAGNKEFMVFSAVEGAVARGEVDAGVIIHESRFTHQAKGLVKLADLGELWQERTRVPIPLGGIVARRALGVGVAREVERAIRVSAELALAEYPRISDYVRRNAQEMDDGVMRKHIALYVNDFSKDLGEDGRRAVRTLLDVHAGLFPGTDAVPGDLLLEP